MTGLLEKIRSLAQAREQWRTAPFASVRNAQKWLQNLPGSTDYDLHHALVEGLERYNGDIRGDTLNRIEILRTIEETGLPLQAKLLAQYLKSYADSDSAMQALWRECHLFWDQLSVAYMPFLRLVLKDGEKGKLLPLGAEITVKSLRYFSLGMRLEYLRGRRPSESAWRRLHKIYRMAEMAGLTLGEVVIEGRRTSCAREYVITILYDLASPYAFRPDEIGAVLKIIDSLQELPVPETALRHGRHSHMVDLAASGGPEHIEERWVPGGRLRYLDLRSVLHELEQRSGQDKEHGPLCLKLSKVIGRVGASRRGPRKPRFGEVKAVFGADDVMKVFDPDRKMLPSMGFINLRDESVKGVGFVLDEEREHALGSLMAIDREEGRGNWQLLAVRWLRQEGYQWLMGTEILSKYPKPVAIEWEAGGSGRASALAIFLPLASVSQGANSNLLLPSAAYSSGRALLLRQHDGTCYRLRLGDIIETHESMLRAGFDVLSRETARTDQ